MEECRKWSKIHHLDIIGIDILTINAEYKDHSQVPLDSVIIRLKQKPKNSLQYKYLIVIDENETTISTNLPLFDIFILKNFRDYKLKIKQLKKLNRKNIGIEINIDPGIRKKAGWL